MRDRKKEKLKIKKLILYETFGDCETHGGVCRRPDFDKSICNDMTCRKNKKICDL